MSTLSVPLNKNLEEIVNSFVKSGYASNKAEVMRKALTFLAEGRSRSRCFEGGKRADIVW